MENPAKIFDISYNEREHSASVPLCASDSDASVAPHTGWPKNWHNVLYALTLPNINRIFKILSLSESGENL